MNSIERIKMNAIKGCMRREILRYLKEPMQTIVNAIFSNLLFFLILYLINTKNISLLIPGIIIFLSFDVISSNLRMTLFVGRLEKTIAAVQDYIVSPAMYLSGCFFSINQVPDLVRRFVQINPIFHFFNISNYLFSGQAEYDLRISFLMCISIAILSTMVCYVIFKEEYGLLR